MHRGAWIARALIAVACALGAVPPVAVAQALPQGRLVGAPRAALSPATKYARLSPGVCRALLRKRALPAKMARGRTPGIATPLRLAGPIHDVVFRTPGARSVYGIIDCRLALALDDLARILARHGVLEVHVDNIYRPRARLPGRKKPSQHAYGLAIDIYGMKLRDQRTLLVERDWPVELAAPPCEPDAQKTDTTDAASELRNIVCEVAREQVFHRLLTPNHDAAHANHLHLDIDRHADATVIR